LPVRAPRDLVPNSLQIFQEIISGVNFVLGSDGNTNAAASSGGGGSSVVGPSFSTNDVILLRMAANILLFNR